MRANRIVASASVSGQSLPARSDVSPSNLDEILLTVVRTMTRQGLLILDNSCYARLADEKAMTKLESNMRAAWLHPGASEVNLLEAAATSSHRTELELVRAIRRFAGRWPLLEWPFALLRRLGQAILDGSSRLTTEASGKEWYLEDAQARKDLRVKVREFNNRLEGSFVLLHENARPAAQRWLKARQIRREIDELPAFLDGEWPGLDLRDEFARATWTALGLPGDAPLPDLLKVPAWRLLLDAEGAAVYARAIVHRQPRSVQRKDLIQLVYLGATGIRILATADMPFLNLASQIVNGRYAGARVLHIGDMLT